MTITQCANVRCQKDITVVGDGSYRTYHHPTEGGKCFCSERCRTEQVARFELRGVVAGLPDDQQESFVGYDALVDILNHRFSR